MSTPQPVPPHITVPEIRSRKATRGAGAPIAMLTAYDVVSARLGDAAGADILLVGDSVGMTVLGRENTLTVTMDEMIHHARAVAAARPRALVVGDMPYLSYQVSKRDAVLNAGRFIREGGCQAVKIEGGDRRLKVVAALLDAEIPVMGHLGLTPQSVHGMGGFRVQARRAEAAARLVIEAVRMAEAGVFAIVLEGVPDEVARAVTDAVPVPTIGIGAGPHCDGQVLVYHDVLGLGDGPDPRFVRRYAEIGRESIAALGRFVEDVRKGAFPSEAESYRMPKQEAEALRAALRRPRPRRIGAAAKAGKPA
jgi:3-methyl-2-oxobutanoate hydroxymethyltransferase